MRNVQWKAVFELLLECFLILIGLSVLIFVTLLAKGNLSAMACLQRSLATFISTPVIFVLAGFLLFE